jgi:hemoglobin
MFPSLLQRHERVRVTQLFSRLQSVAAAPYNTAQAWHATTRGAIPMSNSPQTPYQILGADGIQHLVNTFYDIMDSLPDAAALRAMHAKDLAPMKQKLAEYLTGWMGGPPLYADKYGTVCMTTPHEPYPIGPAERDQWLLCMDKALQQTGASEELVEMLKVPLFRIADAVRNKQGPSSAAANANIIATG